MKSESILVGVNCREKMISLKDPDSSGNIANSFYTEFPPSTVSFTSATLDSYELAKAFVVLL